MNIHLEKTGSFRTKSTYTQCFDSWEQTETLTWWNHWAGTPQRPHPQWWSRDWRLFVPQLPKSRPPLPHHESPSSSKVSPDLSPERTTAQNKQNEPLHTQHSESAKTPCIYSKHLNETLSSPSHSSSDWHWEAWACCHTLWCPWRTDHSEHLHRQFVPINKWMWVPFICKFYPNISEILVEITHHHVRILH